MVARMEVRARQIFGSATVAGPFGVDIFLRAVCPVNPFIFGSMNQTSCNLQSILDLALDTR